MAFLTAVVWRSAHISELGRLSFNIRLKELVAAITTEMCRQYAEASCGRYRAEAVFAELFRTKLDTARERQLLEAVATQQRAAVQDGDEEDEKDQGQDDEGEDHEGDFSLVAGDLPDDGQDVNDELQSEQRALIQQLFTRAKSLDQLKAARDRQKKSVLFTIAKVLQMDFPRVTVRGLESCCFVRGVIMQVLTRVLAPVRYTRTRRSGAVSHSGSGATSRLRCEFYACVALAC